MAVSGGVPRRAVSSPSDGAKSMIGMKRKRDSSASRAGGGDLEATKKAVCAGDGGDLSLFLAGFDHSVLGQKRSKLTRNNGVDAAAVEVPVDPARSLFQKRLALERVAIRGNLKKAQLISREGCKRGAEQTQSDSAPRMKAEHHAPLVKKKKIYLPPGVEVEQKIQAPHMSRDERDRLSGHLASLVAELPGYIVEFLQKRFSSGADPSCGDYDIEIDFSSGEDSVLFELKKLLDKFTQERLNANEVPEQQHDSAMFKCMIVEGTEAPDKECRSKVLPEEEDEFVDICGGVSPIVIRDSSLFHDDDHIVVEKEGSSPSSSSSSSDSDSSDSDCDSCSEDGSDDPAPPTVLPEENRIFEQPPRKLKPASEFVQSTKRQVIQPEEEEPAAMEAEKPQGDQRAAAAPTTSTMSIQCMIARAKIRKQLQETERMRLPDLNIYPRDLKELGIAQYGDPRIMAKLGLFRKASA